MPVQLGLLKAVMPERAHVTERGGVGDGVENVAVHHLGDQKNLKGACWAPRSGCHMAVAACCLGRCCGEGCAEHSDWAPDGSACHSSVQGA